MSEPQTYCAPCAARAEEAKHEGKAGFVLCEWCRAREPKAPPPTIRQVLYVAAPLRPTDEEIAAAPKYNEGGRSLAPRSLLEQRALRANLDRAMRWLAWLRKSFPETTFIAPWIASVLAGADDTEAAEREAGFVDACAVVERCDGIVLCGGRISEGMRREVEHAQAFTARCSSNFWPGDHVCDLTKLPGAEPPASTEVYGISFSEWGRRLDRILR